MSDELRNSLWNLIYKLYEDPQQDRYWCPVAKYVAQFFRKVPVDALPHHHLDCRRWLKDYFYDLEWHELYDLTEFIVYNHTTMTRRKLSYSYGYDDHSVRQDELIKAINFILERELSGYRFVSGVLCRISSPAEAHEIEDAIQASGQKGLHGAREHLSSALKLFGKKPEPDHRNAIKEAISAVESVVKQISGATSAGLGAALDELSKHTDIHGALKAGFKSLYGYTSDEDGIRHGILDQPEVGFTEAKYMIVSCSAFVNYLVAKADGAGLLKHS